MNISNDNTNINFHAGLTKQMKQEISSCDINKISREFAKHHIITDFKDNKIVAWGCLKALEINKALKLKFPNMVKVEDFSKLDANEDAIGFCNAAPTELYLDNNSTVRENSVFFNENYDWKNLDENSDLYFQISQHSTNFFLETFLHEFAHAAHFKNMLLNMSGVQYVKSIINSLKPENLQNLEHKFFENKDLCSYALASPLEFVACDLAKRTIDNLDKNTLDVKTSFISKSPYSKTPFLNFFVKKDEVFKQAKNFWNGNLIV